MNNQIHPSLWASIAKFAPIDVVAEYIQLYRKTVTSDRIFRTAIDPEGSDSKFELAVIERNDSFLNVLLSTCVTDADVAVRLWEWSAEISEKGVEVSSIRISILGTAAIRGLLNTKSIWLLGLGRNKPLISVEEIASNTDDESRGYLRAILANPYCKTLVADCLHQRNDFHGMQFDDLLLFLDSVLRNPALNVRRDSIHNPDDIHMNIVTGIRHVLTNAPTNNEWMWMLNNVLMELEPRAFSFSDQVLKDFREKWLKYQPTLDSDYTLTGLSPPEELVSILFAKFATLNIRQQQRLRKDVHAIEELEERASFFGKARFTPDDLRKTLEIDNSDEVLVWLSFNESINSNPISMEILSREMKASGCSVITKNVSARNLKGVFSGSVLDVDQRLADLAHKTEGVARVLSSLSDDLNGQSERLSNLGYILIFLSVLTLLFVFWGQ